eukprot:Pgem_evm1s19389
MPFSNGYWYKNPSYLYVGDKEVIYSPGTPVRPEVFRAELKHRRSCVCFKCAQEQLEGLLEVPAPCVLPPPPLQVNTYQLSIPQPF